MKHQRLLSYVRRAVEDYAMIEENDKIAIGLSGGKDSICLLLALSDLRRFTLKSLKYVPLPYPLVLTALIFQP